MFAQPHRDQVIAFSGLFQSAMLVYQLANRNSFDEDALKSSSLSVLSVDADSVAAVFGSIDGVSMGCSVVDKAMGGGLGNLSRDIFGYAIAMHQVGQKLEHSPNINSIIHSRLTELAQQFLNAQREEIDANQRDALYEELALLYAKTISTLEPRIMVHGNQGKLSQHEIVNKIRSALFAGVRAGYLWHQLGGRRWHLFLYRNTYRSIAARLAG